MPLNRDPAILVGWKQPDRLTVSQFADQHRVLDEKVANEPGPWSTARVPHAQEWMDSANAWWVRRVSICGGSQIGKTEAGNNVLLYFLSQHPSPCMLVMPNQKTARRAAERRVRPMLDSCRPMVEQMTERSHDLKNDEMVFQQSVLYISSAQSPADLASVPVRLAFGDELGKWPKWSGREASPLKLLQERTRTYYDHLIYLSSTPTTREGLISEAFRQGDQRRRWVPCPHCGVYQVLKFAQIKWPEDITTAAEMERRQEAHYECEHCKKAIDDRQRAAMLPKGVWVPKGHTVEEWLATGQKADRAPHRSYHLWAAYSPWLTWWKIAREFLESKDTPSLMMNFTNSWLAEDWEERVGSTRDKDVEACIDKLRAMADPNAFPADALGVTGTVDVQADRLEWMVQAWGRDEEMWVVGVGKIKGTGPETWEELATVMIRNQWGPKKLRIRTCLIDSRHRRPEVFDWMRKWQPIVRMIVGVEKVTPVPLSSYKLDRHPRTGLPLKQSAIIWSVNVGWFKDLMAARITNTAKDPDSKHGRLHLPNDLPEDFVEQAASEHKILERSGNKERHRWVLKAGHQRNEAWDLLVYGAAAGRMERWDTVLSEGQRGLPPAPKKPGPPRRPHGGGGPSWPSIGGGRP